MPNATNIPDLGPFESKSKMEDPQSNEEVFLGSFSSILQNNLGRYVICEFLIGTNSMTQKEGVLYSGGINYITLYQPIENTYVVCDLYSLKFLTFVDVELTPRGGISSNENPYIKVTPSGVVQVNPVTPNRSQSNRTSLR